MYNPEHQINQYMSRELISVTKNTSLTHISDIFEANNFHHLPVLNDDRSVAGIISLHDIHQLEHHFTLKKWGEFDTFNERFFESLIAKEVMNSSPICISGTEQISVAVDLFLDNIFHSLLVVEEEKCIGIVTPYDILKVLHQDI